MNFHPKYIVENDKVQAVIIQMDEWQKIQEQLEMLEDLEAYDKAKKESSEIISFDQAVKEIRNNELWNKNYKKSTKRTC